MQLPGQNTPRSIAIVPAFQERESIARVVEDIRRLSSADVVVIDDGSGDGTAAAAVRAGARVITLPFNLGIGSAVQTGLTLAKVLAIAILLVIYRQRQTIWVDEIDLMRW